MSRPMRARGLKPGRELRHPHGKTSRPMRARGLKLVEDKLFLIVMQSRPMRARGLKHPSCLDDDLESSRAPCGRVG